MIALRRAGRLRAAVWRANPRGLGAVIQCWMWLLPGSCLALTTFAYSLVFGTSSAPTTPDPVALLEESGVITVTITTSAILVGDDPTVIVPLPSRETLARTGVDAAYKRRGPNDLLIVPLADAATRTRGGTTSPMEALIVADATTPYRLLVEVLFTLGQSRHVGKLHLMVRRKDPRQVTGNR